MAVLHIILHAFGSWHPDHERGWHQHGMGRPNDTDPGLGNYRRHHQKQPAVRFTESEQFQLIERTLDISKRRNWRCHAATADETHVHIVVSSAAVLVAKSVQTTFKRLLALMLSELRGQPGMKWLSRGGRPQPVKNREHLEFLLNEYLPGQGGLFWREGEAGPRRLGGPEERSENA